MRRGESKYDKHESLQAKKDRYDELTQRLENRLEQIQRIIQTLEPTQTLYDATEQLTRKLILVQQNHQAEIQKVINQFRIEYHWAFRLPAKEVNNDERSNP